MNAHSPRVESATEASWEQIMQLRRTRPRSGWIRASLWVAFGLLLTAWTTTGIRMQDLFGASRMERLGRFLREDATPRPLRDGSGSLWSWMAELWHGGAGTAMLATLLIAVLAIVLAAFFAWFLALFGARNLMSAHPFLAHATADAKSCPQTLPRIARAFRLLCVLLRGIPEYIWAFLFLAMLGSSAWPAVLALAIHNAGILGRLGSETVENLSPAPLRAMTMMGASRRAVAFTAIFPLSLGRYLLYFFYRFETCVREATVLGMLGVLSLGYEIVEARAHGRYDEMLFYVVLAMLLVLAADLLSDLARRWLRRGM